MLICLFFTVWMEHDNRLKEVLMYIKKTGYADIAKLAAALCLALLAGCIRAAERRQRITDALPALM